MPRREFHDAIELFCLGEVTGMSKRMDAPSRFMRGHHQRLFHTPGEVMMLSLLNGGNILNNIFAGLMHLTFDNIMAAWKKREVERKRQERGRQRARKPKRKA